MYSNLVYLVKHESFEAVVDAQYLVVPCLCLPYKCPHCGVHAARKRSDVHHSKYLWRNSSLLYGVVLEYTAYSIELYVEGRLKIMTSVRKNYRKK